MSRETPTVQSDAAKRVNQPKADNFCLETLRFRADFLRAARGLRQHTDSLQLQAYRRDEASNIIRVGYTCSKKVGNAVTRNRAKRRLRHLAADILSTRAHPGWDYVLVGRAGTTAELAYDKLRADLIYALQRIHSKHTPNGTNR